MGKADEGSSRRQFHSASSIELKTRKLQQQPEVWDDFAWSELPSDIQDAWEVLGYTEVKKESCDALPNGKGLDEHF